MSRSKMLRKTMIGGVSALALGVAAALQTGSAYADETCQSPYMAKIVGQEDFVYVWTLGIEGLGDGQDKLVTIDVNPKSPRYGKIVEHLVGGRAQRGPPLWLHR